MKFKLALPAFVLLSLCFTGLLAAQDFEGEMQFKVNSEAGNKKDTNFHYFVKGDKVRMEWEKKTSGAGAILMDSKTQKMMVLMPDSKQFMEIPVQPAGKSAQEIAKQEAKLDFSKTGKTENILGYACDQYISKDAQGMTEMWATKELGRFSGFERSGGKEESNWQKQLKAQNLFPLKIFERTLDGKEKSSWEVTKIDKKTLSADQFAPPSDYKKMEMPAMPNMGGMMMPESSRRSHRHGSK